MRDRDDRLGEGHVMHFMHVMHNIAMHIMQIVQRVHDCLTR